MPPIHDVRLRWRSVMLMIAGHLDSRAPLTRIVCMALDQLPAVAKQPNSADIGNNEEMVSPPFESLQKDASSQASSQSLQHHRYHQQEVVMDIEAIKWCHPDQPSIPGQEQNVGVKETGEQRKLLQPVIFVRYVATDSTQESNLVDREAIEHSAKELYDDGISLKRISCSLDEIQYAASLLQEQEACVDEGYRTKWKENSALNGTLFRLSLLRPTLEPLFPYRTAQLKLRAERQAREVKRIEQLARRQRRYERMVKLEAEEQQRKDELETRLARDELVDRVCSKPGCEEWALLQCARCPNACYCRLSRKSIGSVLLSFVLLCINVFLLHTIRLSDQRQDWVQRHGEVCRSEQYIKCALPSCLVRVLIGYTDPSRPFQVNEETTLCSKKMMCAVQWSASPVFRYFCSQAHCEEGKKDLEVTLKEYNSELARQQRELECKQQESNVIHDSFEQQQDADGQQKIADVSDDVKGDQVNHELDSREKDSATAATAITSAVEPGKMKTSTAERREQTKAASKKEGMKEGRSSKTDQTATARARPKATDNCVSEGTIKKGGGSTHSNDTTAALCLRPGCFQPGTKFCASCKTAGYCCAKCQTDDWPRHKGFCEGHLLKMGKDYLGKAVAYDEDEDWSNALKYCDLALAKLIRLNMCPYEDMFTAFDRKIKALRALGRHEEARQISNDLQKTGASPLLLAAEEGHLTVVQILLEQGADINKANNVGVNPLFVAAQKNHSAVVQCLLEHGADVNKVGTFGSSPLHIAALGGHLGVVKLLVEQGADKDKADAEGWTALLNAAQIGHLDVVKCLLDHGADKDKANNDGVSPLYIAAQKGHLTVVHYLLEHGADKDKVKNDGDSPLFIAAQNGHLTVVQCLLEHGADKDKACTDGTRFVAAQEGHFGVVQILLESGADKDKANNDDGYNPLHIAAQEGHTAVVQLLLQHGADMNSAANDSRLPIAVAANEEIEQLLRNEKKRRKRKNRSEPL